MRSGSVSPAALLNQRLLRSLEERNHRLETSSLGSLAGTLFTQVLSTALAKDSNAAVTPQTGLRIADYRAHALPALASALHKALSTRKANAEGAIPCDLPVLPGAEKQSGSSPADLHSSISVMKQNAGADDPSNLSLLERIDQAITRAAEAYNLPAALIRGVIKAESDFQTAAVSPAGAQGLMQLMPGTAKDLGVKNPFDIQQNIDGGARYLRKMLDMFKGNVRLALAAYNAGPGAVIQHRGIPPYQETQQYVTKVLNYQC
ncbi:MAG TPA: lytic transglycosylase domain-containing protein [Thermodesulfobacteriota bacterium]|nr:lytic transglycosylase domain-containing protein [Thermodesulfobacteriota bacterium]HNU73167.1 lytic transglycosylase domain-containing protein [Thermodesulfobacteriota bacterium]